MQVLYERVKEEAQLWVDASVKVIEDQISTERERHAADRDMKQFKLLMSRKTKYQFLKKCMKLKGVFADRRKKVLSAKQEGPMQMTLEHMWKYKEILNQQRSLAVEVQMLFDENVKELNSIKLNTEREQMHDFLDDEDLKVEDVERNGILICEPDGTVFEHFVDNDGHERTRVYVDGSTLSVVLARQSQQQDDFFTSQYDGKSGSTFDVLYMMLNECAVKHSFVVNDSIHSNIREAAFILVAQEQDGLYTGNDVDKCHFITSVGLLAHNHQLLRAMQNYLVNATDKTEEFWGVKCVHLILKMYHDALVKVPTFDSGSAWKSFIDMISIFCRNYRISGFFNMLLSLSLMNKLICIPLREHLTNIRKLIICANCGAVEREFQLQHVTVQIYHQVEGADFLSKALRDRGRAVTKTNSNHFE